MQFSKNLSLEPKIARKPRKNAIFFPAPSAPFLLWLCNNEYWPQVGFTSHDTWQRRQLMREFHWKEPKPPLWNQLLTLTGKRIPKSDQLNFWTLIDRIQPPRRPQPIDSALRFLYEKSSWKHQNLISKISACGGLKIGIYNEIWTEIDQILTKMAPEGREKNGSKKSFHQNEKTLDVSLVTETNWSENFELFLWVVSVFERVRSYSFAENWKKW